MEQEITGGARRLAMLLLRTAAVASPIAFSHVASAKDDQSKLPEPIVQCAGCPAMVRIAGNADPLVANMLVGRTEVTWREYLLSVDEAGCPFPRNPTGSPLDVRSPAVRDGYPMTSIKPDEIDCYIGWLKAKSHKPYRLPTEREWQAFAAIGLPRNVTFADLPTDVGYVLRRARFDLFAPDARDVVKWGVIVTTRLYPPSSAGLYDLFGNAEEATSDREALPRRGGGKPFSLVIVKGGDVLSHADFRPLLDRSRLSASSLSNSVGFRVVCMGC